MPTPPELPPSWDGLHPLVVHFPIALLVVAPLFVLLASVTGKRSFMVSALVLMVLGVGTGFVATNTGEEAYSVYEQDEAAELIDPDYLYDEVATAHGEEAELARNVFAGITAAYAVWVLLAFAKPAAKKFLPRTLVGLLFLAALGYANLLMAVAAHKGGELVHLYGVRANIAAPEAGADE